jgi:hypothetical protein
MARGRDYNYSAGQEDQHCKSCNNPAQADGGLQTLHRHPYQWNKVPRHEKTDKEVVDSTPH